MGPCAACELNSSRSHPRVISALLYVSDSASSNLRPPWLLRLLNGQFLCATPGRANILINEWVSLLDHCMVWGLGLHHSSKFLCHLRKPKPARRSLVPSLWRKVLMYFPHFYPNKFYKDSWMEEKCQISLLPMHSAEIIQSSTMEWPQYLFNWALGIPRFLSVEAPNQYLSTGWVFCWVFSPSLPPSIFWLGRNFSVSSNWAPPSV